MSKLVQHRLPRKLRDTRLANWWWDWAGGGSSGAITYLLDDDYTNSDGTGSRTRTAEPGPDSTVITDASLVSSISNSRMIWSGTPAAQSGFIGSTAFARVAGRAARFTYARMVNTGIHRIGWHTVMQSGMDFGMAFVNASTASAIGAGQFVLPAFPGSIWLIYRSTGFFIASDTKLLWVGNTGTNSNRKPTLWISNGQSPDFDLDRVSVYDLPAPWSVDGPKLGSVDSPVSGEVITGAGNELVEITWPCVTGETLQIDFRGSDDNNCYRLKCSESADTVRLYSVAAGVETEVQPTGFATTFNNGTSYRILIMVDGTAIRTYVDGVLKHFVTTASLYSSNTRNKVSGFASASNFIVWQRDI